MQCSTCIYSTKIL